MQLFFIFSFCILNVFIYCKSPRWRKQQNLQIQPFTFLMDYYIFVIPIGTLIFLLAFPGIFITGNSALALDTVIIIELYLLGLPALLLWNFHIVYPNLQFLCSLHENKILNYKVFKRGTLCLEVVLFCTLIPSIHYITIIFLVGMSLFLEYKIADYS